MCASTIVSIYSLISRCENEIPEQILDTQRELSSALSRYHNTNRRWNLNDLENALQDTEFSKYYPGYSYIQIKLVYDDELYHMKIMHDSLDLKRRSKSVNAWYIPFLNHKVFREFDDAMRRLRLCLDAVE